MSSISGGPPQPPVPAPSGHRIAGDWLDKANADGIFSLVAAAGHQIYVVGGAVRNALLQIPVTDVDMASDAEPQEIIALAEAAGLKVVPTGLDHGTVTVIAGGTGYEITSFRQDSETDGRHAKVTFSASIREDAARRDFTMNALYADASGQVFDPLGEGCADAVAGRLRFVGEPAARIREDHLRILRYFRFYAFYGAPGEGPDPEALAACAEGAEGIALLSRERIGAEFRKLLAAPDPAPSLAAMQASGVLAQALPGADSRAMALLVHLEAGAAPWWLCRLAVLGGADPGPDLRLSRAEAGDLRLIREACGSMLSPAALGFKLGPRRAAAAVLARAALLETEAPPDWQAEVARGGAAVFPLRAADLPELQGAALGAALRQLEQLWLAGDLRQDRAALCAEAAGTFPFPPAKR